MKSLFSFHFWLLKTRHVPEVINCSVSDGRKGKCYLQPPLTTHLIATKHRAASHTSDTSQSIQSLFSIKSNLWFAGMLFANVTSNQLLHNVRGGALGWHLFLKEVGNVNAPGSSCGSSRMGHLWSHLQTASPRPCWLSKCGEGKGEKCKQKHHRWNLYHLALRKVIYNVVGFLTGKQRNLGFFWFLRFFFFLHRHLWHSLLNSLVLLHPPCLPMLSHYRLIMEIFLSLCSGKHPFKPDVWDQKDWPRICTGADMKEWKFHSQTFSGTSSLLPKRSHAHAGSDTPTAFPEWSQLLLKLRRATSLMDRGHEHDWEQLPAE